MIDSPFYTFMPCVNSPDKYCTFKKKRLCRNVQCQAERSTGISPPALIFSQNAIILKQIQHRYHKAQGRYGGTGTVPSFFLPVLRISCQIKGILQNRNFQWVLYFLQRIFFLVLRMRWTFLLCRNPTQSQDPVRNERAGKTILFKTGGGVIYQGQWRCMSWYFMYRSW